MGYIGTLAINPSLDPDLAYDPLKSFAPVALIARMPDVLAVSPVMPARDVQQLTALAKVEPDALRYASGAGGVEPHSGG